MVVEQLNELEMDEDHAKTSQETCEDKKMDSTPWETGNISIDDYKIKTTGMLSVNTTVIEQQ